MANYSQEKRRYHIERIRALLVRNSSLTIYQVQDALEKAPSDPLHLDKDYIAKLINKIIKERSVRMQGVTVNKYLAEFGDEVEALKKQLWLIIQNPETFNKDKVASIRELRNSSKDLFDKMFDAGVFERKIGELAVKGDASAVKVLADALKETDDDTRKKLLDALGGGTEKPETEGGSGSDIQS